MGSTVAAPNPAVRLDGAWTQAHPRVPRVTAGRAAPAPLEVQGVAGACAAQPLPRCRLCMTGAAPTQEEGPMPLKVGQPLLQLDAVQRPLVVEAVQGIQPGQEQQVQRGACAGQGCRGRRRALEEVRRAREALARPPHRGRLLWISAEAM